MQKTGSAKDAEIATMLRMPASLKDRLRAYADADRRSMNSQIVVLLERAIAENEKAETAVTVPAE